MTLARRIAILEATRETVPVPNRKVPYALRGFAEALVAAEHREGQCCFAALVWAKRRRPDLQAAARRGDMNAVEAALATVTQTERAEMRTAAQVLLSWLEGTGEAR